jgi:phosphoribosyl-dephospho-CoA transferase
MEMNPHDLIRIAKEEDLLTDLPLPAWVSESLNLAPFVVVRRSHSPDGKIPVGVRGRERGQRFPAWLPEQKAVAVITPYSLMGSANWNRVNNPCAPAAIRSLRRITPLLQSTGYRWGPTGSVGFELTANTTTVKEDSDLDILVDTPEFVPILSATRLMKDLQRRTLVRVDVQLNTPHGALALAEYISEVVVLVKGNSGPLLLHRNSLWL